MAGRRKFEWDDAKARANLAKHGVPFDYAARVFQDPGVVEFDASHEEDAEVRHKAVGLIEGRLFVVVFTDRVGVCRFISARRANTKERRAYDPVHPQSE
ncbi:MAG: BrnT family toxin [Caulobacterales bacterium]